jgi:hypothetical protein
MRGKQRQPHQVHAEASPLRLHDDHVAILDLYFRLSRDAMLIVEHNHAI